VKQELSRVQICTHFRERHRDLLGTGIITSPISATRFDPLDQCIELLGRQF
jgi:hypothetical protein